MGAGSACRTNFGGGLGEREAKRSLPQPDRVDSADMSFSGIPKNRRIRELQSMAPGFVLCPAAATGSRLSLPTGSKWNRALPGGGLGEREAKRSLPQSDRVGSADRKSAGNSCGFEDLGRFNLWRPMVVDRTRGSKWLSALPSRQRRPEFSGEYRKTEESGNSNLWFPDSCSIRRQQVEPGTARWGSGGARSEAEPPPARPSRQRRPEFFGNPEKPKKSAALIYGG